jgi:hypothetical protein
MEHFKIKDFNRAFEIGIDILVLNSIKEELGKKVKSKIKISKAAKVLKNHVFVSYLKNANLYIESIGY